MRFPIHAQATILDLLTKTSTTLALAIRLLPEPLRQEVSIAHLLFRVAHVLENAELWSPKARVAALRELDALLAHSATGRHAPPSSWFAGRWSRTHASTNQAALEVIAGLPMIVDEGRALRPAAWGTIVRHVRRAIAGILFFSTRSGVATYVMIQDDEDARRYAYVVAGVFGELITELITSGGHVPRCAHRSLWRCANAFGEGLELACSSDDGQQGGVSSCRAELASVASEDLDAAEMYVKTLRQAGAGLGVVGFANLPLRRARSSSHSTIAASAH